MGNFVEQTAARLIERGRSLTRMVALVRWILMAACIFAGGQARAHDPFDGGIQVLLYEDRVETTITLGTDAARAVLESLPLPPSEVALLTRPSRNRALKDLQPALSDKVVQLVSDGARLKVSRFAVLPGEEELVLLVVTARQPGSLSPLTVQASYFGVVESMRPGPVLLADGATRTAIATALVTPDKPTVVMSTQLGAAPTTSPRSNSFVEFLQLGLEHVLAGTDHLLFLGALLLGARSLKSMLIVISAFTLAHSITLALAAFNLVHLSSRVVEPLIAASIGVVCVENILYRGSTRLRYALTFGFGLIHGLGFADALREAVAGASGTALVLPILAFNLGIEGGQLLVAAAAVPLLLLLRRRYPVWDERLTLLLSSGITLIAVAWVWQRV